MKHPSRSTSHIRLPASLARVCLSRFSLFWLGFLFFGSVVSVHADTDVLGTAALVEGSAAGTDSVLLTATPANSTWSATADNGWLHLNSGSASGTGSATVVFTFDANTGATRTGTLTIAGQTLTVTQAASSYIAANPLTALISGLNGPAGAAVDSAGNVYISDTNDKTIKKWTASTQSLSTLVSTGLVSPEGVAVDGAGNVYIADIGDKAVKKWVASTQTLSTLVSTGLNYPAGVAVDGSGNVYIADTNNNTIYKWTAATQAVTTLASGLSYPSAIAVDGAGNVYIANSVNNTIEEWTAAPPHTPITLVPSGLNHPQGLAVDGSGNLYVADKGHGMVKMYTYTAPTYTVSTLVSGLNSPYGVAVDGSGNVYIADTGGNALKEWTASTQTVSPLVDATAGLNQPGGVAVDGPGNVYFADTNNNAIKVWTAATQAGSTLLSTGLSLPQGVAADGSGNVYIADTGNNAIKMWTAATQTLSTLVPSGLASPGGVAVDGSGNVYIADTGNNAIKQWASATQTVSTLVSSGLSLPRGVALDGSGNLYIADTGNNAIKKWTAATLAVSTLVSTGLNSPRGVAVDGSGNVYIADSNNYTIKQWTAATQTVSALMSNGLNLPSGVAVDGSGNYYIADTLNNAIEVVPNAYVDPTVKYISTTAGSDALPAVLPTTASLLSPFAPASDQTWLTLGSLAGGVVDFGFTAGNGRVANITLLGQQIAINQGARPPPAVTANTASLALNASSIVITGTGFDPVAANNLLAFNDGAVGTVTAATTTSLAVAFTTKPTALGSLTANVTVTATGSSGAVQVATIVAAPTVTLSNVSRAINAPTLTITGTNFSTTAASNTVVFNNGAVGTVTAATATSLTVTFNIQPSAIGKLTAIVTSNGGSSGTAVQVAAIVAAPTVTLNTTSRPITATTLTITGTNFSPIAANNNVVFSNDGADGAAGTVTAATATSLTVTYTIKPLHAGSLTAVVFTYGGSSSAVQVATIVAAPVVTMSTASLAINSPTLTITGGNFSTTASNNTVVFNDGAVGAVTASTATSLTVTFSTKPTALTGLTGLPFGLTAIVTVSGAGSSGTIQGAVQVASVVAAPTVTSSTASRAINAPTLTIAGTNFSTTATSNTVVFNDGAVGTVTTATATLLTVTLSTQPTATGSLTAVVTSNGGSSGTAVQVAALVAAPTVTLSAASRLITAPTLTITGTNFSPTAANDTVVFNDGAAGFVSAATATSLTVTFTTLPAAIGSLTANVTVFGGSSGPVQVATLAIAPTVTMNTANLAVNAPTVTIAGANFSTTAVSNTVAFNNGAAGNVVAATTTSLTVTFTTLPTSLGSLTANVTVTGIGSSGAVQVASIVAAPTVTMNTASLVINAPAIVISGANFSTAAASNTVAFNDGAVGTVTAATATSLTVFFTTPPTAVGSLTAVVTTFGGSSGAPVQVATVSPVVTGVYVLGSTTMVEGPAAGTGSVLLTAMPTNSTWIAGTNNGWLHVSATSTSGIGSAMVVFTFDVNPGATRTGTLNIGGQTFTVTQAGSPYVAANPVTALISGLNGPAGLAVDGAGNVYFADTHNNAIKKWTPATQVVTTLVSTGLSHPQGVAVDGSGNLYIADTNNNVIKKWMAATQAVTTPVSTGLSNPKGVAVDGSGNVYIADTNNNVVKMWAAATQTVNTLVASGLASPSGVAVDGPGNVYIADSGNSAIQIWTAATQTVSPLVSSGLAAPSGVAVDGSGNVYIADSNNNAIQLWTAATQTLSPLVSSGLSSPMAVAVDGAGNAYLADTSNNAVKEVPRAFVDPTAKFIITAAGSDSLPVILPATANLRPPFAPASDQGWLTVGNPGGGVVNFSFTAGSSRVAHITLLGQPIGVTQSLVASSNANLSGLVLSAVTLAPAFASATTGYTASVSNVTTSLTVTPTVAQANATVKVNGTTVVSGMASSALPLAVGANTITTLVTAQDGTTTTAYTVTVTRAVSTAPVIAVEQPAGTSVTSGGSAVNFGSSTVGAGVTRTFTVRNTGAVSLTIYGEAFNGANGGDFSLSTTPAGTVAAGSSTTFGLTFTPGASGSRSGTLVLASNDPNNGIFTVNLSGSGVSATAAGGRTVAWGFNQAGQLGNISTTNSATPVAVSTAGAFSGKTVIAQAAGSFHSAALCTDGTVFTWGDNSAGQLGNTAAGVASSVPVPVDMTSTNGSALFGKTVVAISAGSSHILALCSDGTVVAWGGNGNGELGNNGTLNSNLPVAVDTAAADGSALFGKTVVAIAAGDSHSLALCSDGTVAAWGYNGNGELGNNASADSPVPVAVDNTLAHGSALFTKTVVAISGGNSHSLALCSDGTLVAWGDNSEGQLGNNSNTNSLVPVQVTTVATPLEGKAITAVSAGRFHNLAVCSDGTLAAWGYGTDGELGNGGAANSLVPAAIITAATTLAGKTPVAVAAGYEHSLVLCSDGTLAAWGSSEFGQLGDNSFVASTVPAAVSSASFAAGERCTAIFAGCAADHNLAIISSSNAKLSSLALSIGTLAPVFTSATTSYAVSVSNATASLTVTPTVAQSNAWVTVNGAAVASGAASGAIALVEGVNVITTFVTAQDGLTTLTYTVAVTRAATGSTTGNLLTNPGAELALTGWSAAGTSSPGVDNGSFDAGIHPRTGGSMFFGGAGASGTLSQTVSLLNVFGITTAQIDAGTATADVSFWEQSLGQAPDDDAQIVLTFLNASSASLGSVNTSELDSPSSWTNHSESFVIPAGTRSIQYQMVFIRHSGTDLDAFIDDNSLTLTVPSLSTSPAVTTLAATGVGSTSATLNGLVNANGVNTMVTFDYGTGTSYGMTVAGTPSPVTGSTATAVSAALTGLAPATTYHFLATGAGSGGAGGGQDLTFTTLPGPANNASLASLLLSAGTLSPNFASPTTNYTASVSFGTTSLIVTPTAAQANATVSVNGTAVASGAASSGLALAVGPNTITTVVTAQDGTTTMSYTLVVTRASSTGTTVTQGWVQRYGGPASNYSSATAVDGAGNVAVTGRSPSISGFYWDYYTAKYAAADGHLLWEQRYDYTVNGSQAGDSVANSVAVDSTGNVIVTGTSGNDAYTVKYAAADGHVIWADRHHGTSSFDGGEQVTVDYADNVVTMGFSTGNAFYIAKHAAADGHLLWELYHPGIANDLDGGRAIAVDGAGNVVVTGATSYGRGSMDYYTAKYAAADGHLIWEQYYDGPSHGTDIAQAVAVDSAGNVAVTGKSVMTGQGYDFYTVKYAAADGHMLWEQRFNDAGNNDDSAYSVAMDGAGNVFVTGSYPGTAYYTAKYDSADGHLLWQQNFSGPPNNDGTAFAIAVDASGSPVVTGFSATGSNGSPGFSQDFYTVKYDAADGHLLWQMAYDGPAHGNETMWLPGTNVFQSFSGRLALTADGGAVLTGLSPNSSGYIDYCTVKYTPAINSSNATLAGLGLSTGTLSPVFASATTSYTASVPNATSTLTVTPTAAQAGATVTVNGIAVTSGAASSAMSLAVGSNPVSTVVTAQDGTTMTYTVTVTRMASTSPAIAIELPVGTPLISGSSTVNFGSSPVGTGVTQTFTLRNTGAVSLTTGGVSFDGANGSDFTLSAPLAAVVTAGATINFTVIFNPAAVGSRSGALHLVSNDPNTGSFTINLNGTGTSATASSVLRTLTYHQITTAYAGQAYTYNEGLPVLSRNGNVIAFTQTVAGGINKVFTLNPDGTGLILADAYTSLSSAGSAVDISDDGTRLCVSDAVQLRAGGQQVLVLASNEINGVRISGDGTKIFFRVYRDTSLNGTSQGITRGIWVINYDGSGLRQIVGVNQMATVLGVTPATVPLFGSIDARPVDVSADGSCIVFSMLDAPVSGGAGQGLFGVNLDGSGLHDFLGRVAFLFHGAISGDGTKVAYDEQPVSGNEEAGVFNFNGTGQIKLTDSTVSQAALGLQTNGYHQLTFDGSKLLLGASGLLFNTDGSGVVQLGMRGPEPLTLVDNSMTSVTMNGNGTIFSYICLDSNSRSQLAVCYVNPGSFGVAPSITSPNLDPPYILPAGNSAAALTAVVSAAFPVEQVVGDMVLNGMVESNSGAPAIALNDAGTSGDLIAGDGIYSSNGLSASVAEPLGPRTVRVKAGIVAADGTRHASAIDIAPFALISSIPPAATTLAATNVTGAGATLNGSVNAAGTSTDVSFDYGTSIIYTSHVAGVPTPVTGNSATAVSANLTGLVSGVTYHYRVNGTSTSGSSSGRDLTFSTGPESNNATLSGLVLSSGSLTPAFSGATTGYAVGVPNATTSVTIKPTAAQASATVQVNGVAVASGVASGAIPLTVGTNTITAAVTAQDGITTINYTVTIIRAASLSSNAALASLGLSAGTLSPVFSGAVTSYTASVLNPTTALTVTPAVAVPGAIMKVNGVDVASGSASGSIALAAGPNTITTLVTAPDGVTTKTYTVIVTRAAGISNDATLSGLTLSAGTASPAFASRTTNYTLSVPNTTAYVKVTPVVTQANATVKINGSPVASGAPSRAVNLVVGSNTITTVVTAQDGLTTVTYTVTVTRAGETSSNATLSGLGLSVGTLSPAFASATTSYSASVPSATTSMSIRPTAAQSSATIKVNGVAVPSSSASSALTLVAGTNTITIVVTAPDGTTTTTYTVTVTRISSAAGTNVFISSTGDNTIKRYTASGAYLGNFVTAGSGGLRGPVGLAFGPDGNLYVASASTNQILKYSGVDGSFLGVHVGSGLVSPRFITFGPDQNLYIASYAGGVQKFSGNTLTTFISPGNGEFEAGVFGPDGNLYVSDFNFSGGGGAVHQYNGTTGAYIKDFVTQHNNLSNPAGLDFGPDGNLYVADYLGNSAPRYQGPAGASPGTFINAFASTPTPRGVAFDPSGNLFLSDAGDSRVDVYQSNGQFLTSISGNGLNTPAGIAFAPGSSSVTGGRVVSWGANFYGGLGNNSVTQSSVPVPVDAAAADGSALAGKTVIAMAGGTYHSVALCSDGTLAAWGGNFSGSLGTNSTRNSKVPVAVNTLAADGSALAGKTVVAVAAGSYHSLALCSDGTVASWGGNNFGALGNSTTTDSALPAAVNAAGVLSGKRVTAVSAGYGHSLALCSDGTLAAWGYNAFGQLGNNSTANSPAPVLVTTAGTALAGKTVVAISAGFYHSLALCSDGTVASWGCNKGGGLGSGSTADSHVPVAVTTSGTTLAGRFVIAISAGNGHNLALCSDGTLAAWGSNAVGSLGNNTTADGLVPAAVDVALADGSALAGKTVIAIASGDGESLALCSDGTLAGWGWNAYGEVGNNSSSNTLVPVPVNQGSLGSGERYTGVFAGSASFHVLATVATAPAPVIAVEQPSGTALISGSRALSFGTGAVGVGVSKTFTIRNTGSTTLTVSGVTFDGANGSEFSLGTAPAVTVVAGASTSFVVTFTPGAAGSRSATLHLASNDPLASPFNIDLSGAGANPATSGPTSVTTLIATSVTSTGATLNGTVNAGGLSTAVSFDYGTSTAYGTNVAGVPTPVSGSTDNAVSATLSGLTPGTTYHYRVNGTAGATVNGGDLTFTTISNNASLSGLSLSTGSLSPTFAGATLSYAAGVSNATTAVTVTPAAAQAGANVTVNGVALASGTTGSAVSLAVGINTIAIVVTAQDGVTTKTYTVAVTRAVPLPTSPRIVIEQPAGTGLTSGISAIGFGSSVVGVKVTRTFTLRNSGGAALAVSPATIDGANRADFVLSVRPPATVAMGSSTSFVVTFTPAAVGSRTATLHIPSNDPASSPFNVNLGGTGVATVASLSNGRALAWGCNLYGELGNNTVVQSSAPVAVTATGVLARKSVIALAGGAYHTLALCSDGTLAAWGVNYSGELGTNSTAESNVPVLVDTASKDGSALAGKTVVAIAAGSNHSLALCSDGTLAAWGENNFGQLGNNTTIDSRVPSAVSTTGILAGKRVAAISAGGYHNLALCTDGTVVAWGGNPYGQLGNNSTTSSAVPVAVATAGTALAGKTVIAVSAGIVHSLALCSDGTVCAWGFNWTGELGIRPESMVSSSVPIAVDATAGNGSALAGKFVVAIAAGDEFSMALCSDGTMAAWGADNNLGNDSLGNRSVPVAVMTAGTPLDGKRVSAIAAGYGHSLALCTDGTLCAWGVNGYGELGSNTAIVSYLPTAVGTGALAAGEHFTSIFAGTGAFHSLAIASTSTAGSIAVEQPAGVGLVNGASAVDFGPVLVRANASRTFTIRSLGTSSLVLGATTVDGVNAGEFTVTAYPLSPVTPAGSTTLMVNFSPGGVGLRTAVLHIPSSDPVQSPFNVTLTGTGSVASLPSIAVEQPAGTGLISGMGTLGFGSTAPGVGVSKTFTVRNNGASALTIKSVSFDGANGSDFTLSTAPAAAVAPGSSTAFVVTFTPPIAGSRTGALHLAGNDPTTSPFTVNLSGSGSGAPLARRAVAWGLNSYGELGNNSTTTTGVPVAVSMSGVLAGKTITSLAAGHGFTLALCSDGTLAAWGYNEEGELGNKATSSSNLPVLVDAASADGSALAGKTVVAISAGGSHSLALCSDGTVVAWGDNGQGQLGSTSTGFGSVALVPVAVNAGGALAGKKVAQVSAGGTWSLALCTDGTVVGWGDNAYGQLGNNSMTDSPVPVAVDTSLAHGSALAGKVVTAIAAGGGHSLALCSDGTVAAWGNNSDGELGNGSTNGVSSVPVSVLADANTQLTGIIALATGTVHSLALASNHTTIYSWGWNTFGQLGYGSVGGTSPFASVVPTVNSGFGTISATALTGKAVLSVAAGNASSLALCSDGTVAAWGDNAYGQLGNNSIVVPGAASPVPVAVGRTALAAGEQFLSLASGCDNYHCLAVVGVPRSAAVAVGARSGVFSAVLGGGSGFITVTMLSSGTFTGTLSLGETSYPVSGKIGGNGLFAGSFGKPPVSVMFYLGASPNGANAGAYTLTGVAGGVPFTAYHAAYVTGQSAAETGKYTILLGSTDASGTAPHGTGYATLSVSTAGRVALAGQLADGTAFTSAGSLVGSGGGFNQYVFYNTIVYSGKGLLGGTMTFEPLANSSCDGVIAWFKPAHAGDSYYSAGINTQLALQGALYRAPPAGTMALHLPSGLNNGTVQLSGGSLSPSISEPVTLSALNALTVSGTSANTEKLKLTINAATGSLTGSFVHPLTQKVITFGGVLYQDPDLPQAGGYFLGPVVGGVGQSGDISLTPSP